MLLKNRHRSNFFSNPQICGEALLPHPRAIPDPAPAALSTAPSSLGRILWQSLSPLFFSSALTTLSWLVSAGAALHLVLSTVLPFLMCCTSELCYPFVASTLQAHSNSVALVSPHSVSVLGPWNPVQFSCRWLPRSYCLPVLMPSFLKTYFCHISSRKYHPSNHRFKKKARRRRWHFLISWERNKFPRNSQFLGAYVYTKMKMCS